MFRQCRMQSYWRRAQAVLHSWRMSCLGRPVKNRQIRQEPRLRCCSASPRAHPAPHRHSAPLLDTPCCASSCEAPSVRQLVCACVCASDCLRASLLLLLLPRRCAEQRVVASDAASCVRNPLCLAPVFDTPVITPLLLHHCSSTWGLDSDSMSLRGSDCELTLAYLCALPRSPCSSCSTPAAFSPLSLHLCRTPTPWQASRAAIKLAQRQQRAGPQRHCSLASAGHF
jgi:hypothetical protein